MEFTGLQELISAQRAYSTARNQAVQAAQNAEANSVEIGNMQRQALLKYLQDRVTLLTRERDAVAAEYNDEIAQFQQKIGALQQPAPNPPGDVAPLRRAPAPPAAPAAGASVAASQKTAPQPIISPKKKP